MHTHNTPQHAGTHHNTAHHNTTHSIHATRAPQHKVSGAISAQDRYIALQNQSAVINELGSASVEAFDLATEALAALKLTLETP